VDQGSFIGKKSNIYVEIYLEFYFMVENCSNCLSDQLVLLC
jgi:hypothetical protein